MRALLFLVVGLGVGAGGVWYWLGGQSPTGDAAATSEVYTCPMHPQIMQGAPGACPICGMDLVSKGAQPASAQPPASQPVHDHGTHAAYTCPMHPQIVESEPGECPICGMDLVEKAVAASQPTSQPAASQPMRASTDGPEVTIDPVTRQNMGVRLATAQAGIVRRTVRTVGTVVTPEDRQAVVNLRYSGWITKLHVAATGVAVSKGDPLFEVYSPELVGAQQEYMVARRTAGPTSSLAKAAKQRLKLYQASALTRWIDKGKAPLTRFTVRAPAGGHVLHLNAIAGGRVVAGADLYRIADLARVWVEAEVYAHDAPFVQVGAPAQVELSAGEERDARVDYIYPTLDPMTRTLRVRMELPNGQAGGNPLRPGDIATVRIGAQSTTADVVVPAAAVVHSGTRALVFVHRGEGRFAPREVQVGLRGDDGQVQIRAGLAAGAEIVTSGQFLIDSESQLQEALQKMMRQKMMDR